MEKIQETEFFTKSQRVNCNEEKANNKNMVYYLRNGQSGLSAGFYFFNTSALACVNI